MQDDTSQKQYVVLCRGDRKLENPSVPGDYVLATRHIFHSLEIATDYAKTVSPSRKPLVTLVVWTSEGE